MATEPKPITQEWLTYNSKRDTYNSDQRFLVKGSINTLIADGEKFRAREGYTLQSPAGTGGPILASTDWGDSTADEFTLVSYFTDPAITSTGGILKVLINGVYETLMDSLTSCALIFDPYWDDTEKIDRLIWCDGSVDVYDWSGAVATLDFLTATTIKCTGVKTFGQQRFLTTGTRSVRIKDDNGVWREATYSGGEGTFILTGVGTDLTIYPMTGGNLIVQKVVTRSSIISSTFKVDFLRVIDNQAWLGSRASNSIYVSKNTNIANYTFSTPRAVGEGAQLVLDGPGRAVETLRGDVIVFAGKGYVYKSVFNQITVGATLAETMKVVLVKTTTRQSALHQNLVANIGNGLIWVGYDNVLYELFDATIAYNPDLRAISDPIKPDFDVTDFTGGHLRFHKTRLYISAPVSSRNFIYEFRLNEKNEKVWFWQPPQTMLVNRWAVISNLIHGHSSVTSETYKLFDGYNDKTQAIHSIALLGRWSGGVRKSLKGCDEMFNEGAITPNTKLGVTYAFDLDGGENQIITKTISGLNTNLLYTIAQDPSLGNLPEGDASLSGDVTGADPIMHFRCIDDLNPVEFFDYSVMFETNDVDYRWEINSHGSNAVMSTALSTEIKNDN